MKTQKPEPVRAWTSHDSVQMAIVGRPHGIRGTVTLWPHNPASQLLQQLFRHAKQSGAEAYTTVLAAPVGENATPVRWEIIGLRPGKKGTLLAEIDGLSDRDEAARYRGWRLFVSKTELPELSSPEEFYFYQLERAEVQLESGRTLGQVRRVIETSCEVLEIQRTDGSELLIPVLQDTVKELGPPVVLFDEAVGWFDTEEAPKETMTGSSTSTSEEGA